MFGIYSFKERDITKVITIDLRERSEYNKNHFAWAINIPAEEFSENGISFIANKYYIREIIISIYDNLYLKEEPRNECYLSIQLIHGRQQFEVAKQIRVKLDQYLRALPRFRKVDNIDIKIELISENTDIHYPKFKGLPKKDTPIREDDNNNNIIIVNEGHEDDNNNNNNNNNSVNYNSAKMEQKVILLSGKLALFSESEYFQVVQHNTEVASRTILDLERSSSSFSRLIHLQNLSEIDPFKVVFDFSSSDEPQFPEFLKLSNRSVGKPKLLNRAYNTQEEIPVGHPTTDQRAVRKRDILFGWANNNNNANIKKNETDRETQKRLIEKHLTDLDYGNYYEFEFENGYSIEWIHIPVKIDNISDSELEIAISSAIKSMEPYKILLRRKIGILWNEFTIPAILCFLVGINKWPLIKAYNYLLKQIPSEKFYSPILVRCARILLSGYEFYNSLYTFPSISLKLVVTHQLQMENLSTMISFNKSLPANKRATTLRKNLFSNLRVSNFNEVKNILSSNHSLIYSRVSFKKRDLTPLLLMLEPMNGKVPTIENLMMVTDKISVTMTSSEEEDVMKHAVSFGSEIVSFFVKNGALIDSCSGSNRVPLQTAIKHALPLSTLKLLINERTINHKDIDFRTPLHYVVLENNYLITVRKEIIEFLVRNGANMYLEDLKRNTPMSIALHYSSDANTPENIRQNYREIYDLFHHLSINEGCNEENGSFAPIRDNINVKMFVDGEDYFTALSFAMYYAKHKIYIADWWLSPYLQLIRSNDRIPPQMKENYQSFRLDYLLKEKANLGVKIYVILWENMDRAVPIKNELSATILQNLHPHIQVVMHSSSMTDSWSHHQKLVVIDDNYAFLGGLDLCFHRWDTPDHKIIDPESKFFQGKDYFCNDFNVGSDLHHPFADYKEVNRLKHCRLPWHDVSVSVDGLAAADVAKNFVQRWNFIINYKKLRNDGLALPAMNGDNLRPREGSPSRCQITRSIAQWSVGFAKKECSILTAMLKEIADADHFIYIENQYFISFALHPDLTDSQDNLKNIGDALINRIKKAFLAGLDFKVIVVLPEYPEGNAACDVFIQRIMYWQMKTIVYVINEVKDFTSLTLKSCDDYITFHSLRNHDELNGIPVSEQIYVHAKLMITDKAIICGSANINLRSLCGNRDSEIAAVIHNPTLCNELRKKLWREHLGESAEITDNFLVDAKIWKRISRKNTKYYKNLFGLSTPQGEPKESTIYLAAREDFVKRMSKRPKKMIHQIIKEKNTLIRGHVVDYPLRFLEVNVIETERTKTSLNPYTLLQSNVFFNTFDYIFQ